MDMDVSTCTKRNTHKRTEEEVETIFQNWERTPASETLVDVRSLLQAASITEVSKNLPSQLSGIHVLHPRTFTLLLTLSASPVTH